MRTETLESTINKILTLGTCIAMLFILAGGTLYLLDHGTEVLSLQFSQPNVTDQLGHYFTEPFSIFAPLNLISVGIIFLVGTQVLKVFLLTLFYLFNKDYPLSSISAYVLLILIISLVWRR